jgi:subtilisin family serine protease
MITTLCQPGKRFRTSASPISRRALYVALLGLAPSLLWTAPGCGDGQHGPPDPAIPAVEAPNLTPSFALPDFRKTGAGLTAKLPVKVDQPSEDKMVHVYVVLEQPSVAKLARTGPPGLRNAADLERHAETLSTLQSAVIPKLRNVGATPMRNFRVLANAVRVRVLESRLDDLRALPGVVRVDPVTRVRRSNAGSVPFLGVPSVWEPAAGSFHGEGVSIGVIDTGIDYLHADFGGAGDPAAFAANDPTVIEQGTFPTAKVVGGYDFVGDVYDGEDNDTAEPDDDPIDCNGHGSHVGGTAAGAGVLLDGSTYTGSYSASLDMKQFRIGPGMAPKADLYALKIFGCDGPTWELASALEWAADPNGDGNFDDRLDVINMSLGDNFAMESESEVEMLDLLATVGTAVFASAGNAGDTFYIQGSPASHSAVVSVAASYDDAIFHTALDVTSPSSIAKLYEAAEGATTKPLADTGNVTGDVVASDPPDGCAEFANAAEIAGKIALINRGTCIFTQKVQNAQSAGAIAVAVVNNVPGEPIVMGGENAGIDIPGVMISLADGDVLKAELANEVTVTATMGPGVAIPRPDLTDQIVSFSSRGPHTWNQTLKPDVSAPGSDTFSVDVGTGNVGTSMSGTSMACPHAAGLGALIRQANPTFTPADVKAAMMNATVDAEDAAANRYPESRMGAGRISAPGAVNPMVIAYDADHPEAVSISLGLKQLVGPHSETRTIELKNHFSVALNFDVSVEETVVEPGVIVTPMVSTVSVPAGGTAQVSVRFDIDPTQFDRAPDPTTASDQGGIPRNALTEASGRVLFTSGSITRRVPYHMVLNAASDTQALWSKLCLPHGPGSESVLVPTFGTSSHTLPIVSAFELAAQKPASIDPASALSMGDILAVGITSDAPSKDTFDDANLYFAMVAASPWATPLTDFTVMLDLDQNGSTDAYLWPQNYGWATSDDIGQSTDAVLVWLYHGPTGFFDAVGFVNLVPPGTLDTALFNSNVLVMSVPVSLLGLTEAAPRFSYRVASYVIKASADVLPWMHYDALRPIVDTASGGSEGLPFYLAGAPIDARVDTEMVGADKPQLLLLHHMNTHGKRHEIVTLEPAAGGSDLQLTVTQDAETAFAGVTHNYKLTVTNASSVTSTDTYVSIPPIPGAKIVSKAPNQGYCSGSVTVTCLLGQIAAGATAEITLGVSADTVGSMTVKAQVAGASCDPNGTNNVANLSTTVDVAPDAGVPDAEPDATEDAQPDVEEDAMEDVMTDATPDTGPDVEEEATVPDAEPDGASGTGGSSGSGGSGGSSGTGGTAGTGGTGGKAETGGSTTDETEEEDGCGCRTVGGRGPQHTALFAVSLLAVGMLWRRKRAMATTVAATIAALFSTGCHEKEVGSACGSGTYDSDGTCLPKKTDGGLTCGPGTREENGKCVADGTGGTGGTGTGGSGGASLTCGAGTEEINGVCVPIDAGAPGVPGQIGDPCSEADDCTTSYCAGSSVDPRLVDGYCTKVGCGVNNPCPTGSTCQDVGFGVPACFRFCEPATQQCRSGQACQPLLADPSQGICLPRCTSDETCPAGALCHVPSGICTPPETCDPASPQCAEDHSCLAVPTSSTGGYCFPDCESYDNCKPKEVCQPLEPGSTDGICVPAPCLDSSSCPALSTCVEQHDGQMYCKLPDPCVSGMCTEDGTTCLGGVCLAACEPGTAGDEACKAQHPALVCAGSFQACLPSCASGCQGGMSCFEIDQVCLPTGTFPGSPCLSGDVCLDVGDTTQSCVHTGSGAFCMPDCTVDTDCESVSPLLTCVESRGLCAPKCEAGTFACGDGLACERVNNACLPEGSFPGSPCGGTASCATNFDGAQHDLLCMGGMCLIDCATGGDVLCGALGAALDMPLSCDDTGLQVCLPPCGAAPGFACASVGDLEMTCHDTLGEQVCLPSGTFPGSPCRTDPADECDQNLFDVGAYDMVCIESTCALACEDDALCASFTSGIACYEDMGICLPACTTNAQCASGRACYVAEGVCLPNGMFPGGPCGDGETCGNAGPVAMECQAGKCVIPCEADAECAPLGLTCLESAGLCVEKCVYGTCDSGYSCLAPENACLPTGSFLGSPCATGKCSASLVCSGNRCRAACTDAADGDSACAAIDPALTCEDTFVHACMPACDEAPCATGMTCVTQTAKDACVPTGSFPGSPCRNANPRCDANIGGVTGLDLICVDDTACRVDCSWNPSACTAFPGTSCADTGAGYACIPTP